MKKVNAIAIALFLSAMTTLVSCTNQNAETSPVSSSQLKDGAWKVTYFWDKDHDETASLSSYEIMFNDNGSVTAVNGSDVINGTWVVGSDDSQPKLILTFSAAPFSEISDDWHVTNQTNNLMNLEDVSGGNGSTELLTLEKI